MTRELYRSSNGIVIIQDGDNWIVGKANIVKEGKTAGTERIDEQCYYSSVESACKSAASKVARDEAATLHGYIVVLQSASDDIVNAIKGKK